tara:strand:- start:1229 stop:1930 length:702 start_codon:yes stop_codon:yes gene_type:complete
MAISVDTVYKTVLFILNKEQRGYMTPEEFNKVGAQAQLEIFEKYFEDLNQLTRIPQNDMDYADRVAYLDDKISIFKNVEGKELGSETSFALPDNTHIIGTITSNDIELQRVSRNEYYNIIKSPLTKPTLSYPIYLLESSKVKVSPSSIAEVSYDYIIRPVEPQWNYTVGTVGQFIFNTTTQTNNASVDFELHNSEQVELVLRILSYAGIIIRDPNIVQAAASQVQQANINEKS